MNFKIGFEINTDIPTDFINKFLIISNPSYFVIYLYTFRRVALNETNITYADIAMEIEFVTENDVLACFKYYEKKGIIKIEDDLITFLPINTEVSSNNVPTETVETPSIIELDKKPVYGMREIELYRKHNADFSNIFILAEKNFGRTLKQSDMFIIFDIYDRLMLPVEVIEFLIEYYTAKGITNMSYIEKKAQYWYDKDIKTKEEALSLINAKNEDYIRVRKALGMDSKRDKTFAEEKMLEKFYNEYGFDINIILEGCDAAVMSSKGSPSYNYLEGTLSNWYNEGIRTLDDVKKRSMEIEDNRKNLGNRGKKGKTTSKNKFANFSQKSLDFDKYEKLNRQRIESLAKGED